MMYGGSKMNKNQLDRLIEQYIERFEELNSEPNSEGYKWETFQKFTDAWNIDSPDFKGMFEDAFNIVAQPAYEAAIDENNQLWTWGCNVWGQCGIEDNADTHCFLGVQ